MPTISFRISEEERERLLAYGSLSDSLREAVEMYLNAKKSDDLLRKLRRLQRENPVKLSSEDIVRSIREDRDRR